MTNENRSFEDRYRDENDEVRLSADARQRIARVLAEAEAAPEAPPKKRALTRIWIPAAATAAVACALLLAVALPVAVVSWGMRAARPPQTASYKTQPVNSNTYEDIYEVVMKTGAGNWGDGRGMGLGIQRSDDMATSPEVGIMADEAAPLANTTAPLATEMAGGGEREFSTTNVQVEGIDEADIVKTDGDYLYILAHDRLVIAQAEAKDTQIVSDTTIASSETTDLYPIEMFLAGDRLIVLFSESEYPSRGGGITPLTRLFDTPENLGYIFPMNLRTITITYDISDPAKPQTIARTGQDGSYITSRLQNGIVYVITTHSVYDKPTARDPQTFVPSRYTDDEKIPLPAECIVLPDCPASTSYVVVTSMSAKTGEQVDWKSLLGYTSTVYMNQGSLIMAQSVYTPETVSTTMEDQYKVEHHVDGYNTHIVRFAIDEGELSFVAEGEVPGDLLNQFSIDEYDGHIRLVTTVSSNEYKIYTDEKRGFEHYEYLDNATANALYVLDLECEIVGKITDLAKDEYVYSVRFVGDIGYFVTFRQVDPLFAVDLSNPKKPKVLSALKIPGFSQYLHPYGDGLLFGLGMEADEETGMTTGMKMSMFDVSDPTDVTEKHKLLLDSYYSEALYNHKAILIMPDKNIIAFPAEDGYVVYGYSSQGFAKQGEMKFNDAYMGRGVIIDDLLYVCTTSSIGVFELERFTPITDLTF